MKKPVRHIDGRIIILPLLLLLTIFVVCFNDIFTFVIANIILAMAIGFLVRMDVKNPIFIWTLVFSLYQIAYPVLNNLGIIVYEYCPLNEYYYILSWLATCFFVIFYGSFNNVRYDRKNITTEMNVVFLRMLYWFLVALCLVSSITIVKDGFQSKYDLAQSMNVLLNIGNMAYTALIILPVFFVLSKNISRREKVIIATSTFFFLLVGVFTYGERSYVFNYLLMMMILYFTFRKISLHKVLIIAFCFVLFFSFSPALKMLFANEHYSTINDGSNDSIMISFLNSDFSSAGFNFNYVLNHDDAFALNGKSFFYDVLSPLDGVFNLKKHSSTRWYTDKYWNKRRTGLGFSLIAEGYVNFGFLGIIFQMFIIARLIKFFYLRSNRNCYYYVLYIGLIALAMYSCRQSLGSVVSPLIKYYAFMCLMVLFANKVGKRGTNE